MKIRRLMMLLLAVAFLSVSAVADDIQLYLLPSSDIAGPAGSTVGWGYDLYNNTPLWILPTAVSSDAFLYGTPNLIFDFPAVAPFSDAYLDFSLVAGAFCTSPPCGFYSLAWDTTAPDGFVNSGTFTVSSDYYDGDPNNGGNDLGPAPDASAAYSATVTGSAVPEPTSLLLILSGLGAVGWRTKRT
ncbi:MAG TPA: PEP-CTERM sorting domain-containing protein [Terriglobales bacterium]|nr:PEP-CTERM sorting domain-containing protein [Terriglobales bacterium]